MTKLGKCTHKKGVYKCNELHPQDVRKFHAAFYKNKDKNYQDQFILKYLKTKVPARRKRKVAQRHESQTFTAMYIKTFRKPYKLLRVCQKVFLMILDVGVHRIRRISKNFLTSGQLPTERRGGDKRSLINAPKKRSVMRFIEKFKCIESHYCRSETSERKYMSSDLNIKKMWRMYNQEHDDIQDLKVKECFFRHVFNTKYNIGFKMPRVDVCSKCTELTEKIKVAKDRRDEAAKAGYMTEMRLHKLKAKCFYEYLKERNESILTMSFDCQKNQVLPKVPDQIAYYSRQLYINNFTIVVGSSTGNIAKDNVYCYTWTENTHAKSANEIASAVFYQLTTQIDISSTIKKIRLMADGCGSQNKNSIMITMCAHWLTTHAPATVKCVELIFPVPGHSFMPADRVFGNIEKEIKNNEVMVQPSQYIDIYNRYGQVIKLGDDCPVNDWKSYAEDVTKPPGLYHFKFSDCKRYFIKRVKNNPQRFLLKGEVNYRAETGAFKSVMKRGIKKMNDFGVRTILPNKVNISKAKLEDVDKLLRKHYGDAWKDDYGQDLLSFYKNVLDNNVNDNASQDENIEPCEYLPEVGMSV